MPLQTHYLLSPQQEASLPKLLVPGAKETGLTFAKETKIAMVHRATAKASAIKRFGSEEVRHAQLMRMYCNCCP
jgi:hypothetical protein